MYLDVYSELTTEGSSRLSTVEVFNAAMQRRGLVQSMKSSVPPVRHADDLTHVTVLTPQFKLYNVLVLVMQGPGSDAGQIDLTEKVAARDDAYTAGWCLLARTWSLQFPKTYTDAMQSMLHWHWNCCQHFMKKSNECRTYLFSALSLSSLFILSF